MARVDANPRMLRFARDRAGLSVGDVAKLVQVRPDRYAVWEEERPKLDKEKPTVRQLQTLGDRLKRPFVFFLLDHPPSREIDPDDFKDFRRAAGSVEPLSRWLRYAIRHAHERRIEALELAEEANATFPLFDVSCDLKEDPETAGARLRKRLGVTLSQQKAWSNSQAPTEWKRVVSRAGVLVFEFSNVEIEEARGFAMGEKPLPVVGINGHDVPVARNFTLFHELVHVMLGRAGVISDTKYNEHSEEEAFCNATAAAALIPRKSLLSQGELHGAGPGTTWPDSRLGGLATRFGVSRHVMLRRLLTIGATSADYYWARNARFVREYAEMKKERKKASRESPPKLPLYRRSMKSHGPLYAGVILHALAARSLTSAKASSMLSIRPDQIGDMQREVMRALL